MCVSHSILQDPRIKKAIACMESQLHKIKDSYTTSILTFALKRAGSTRADDLMKNLDKKAVRKGKEKTIFEY